MHESEEISDVQNITLFLYYVKYSKITVYKN